MQMKFYSPLTAEFFPNDTEDLGDDYSEYEGIPYTGKELAGYRDVIRDAIYEDVKDFYGDLMRYYREDDSVRRRRWHHPAQWHSPLRWRSFRHRRSPLQRHDL